MSITTETPRVKAYSKTELANLYGITVATLRTWLKTIKLETGRRNLLTPNEVQTIFDKIGNP